MSIMGGRFWQDNGDGTFTPQTRYASSGPSWLDLYAMGLAHADEVPDTFILRDLQVVEEAATTWPDGHDGGLYRGRKERVSIDQVVAAEGRREPRYGVAQTVFNAGFVTCWSPVRHLTTVCWGCIRDTATELWNTGVTSRAGALRLLRLRQALPTAHRWRLELCPTRPLRAVGTAARSRAPSEIQTAR